MSDAAGAETVSDPERRVWADTDKGLKLFL
jgi:hypothetical protein